MVRTLDALAGLPAGGVLVQHNERVPAFLLPELDAGGYRYEVEERESVVVTRIWRTET
jgi:hypothetical protein